MKVIIDRFEGKYAVCEREDLEIINIERDKIPQEAKEGDVLIIQADKITIYRDGTEQRRRRIEKLMDELWD